MPCRQCIIMLAPMLKEPFSRKSPYAVLLLGILNQDGEAKTQQKIKEKEGPKKDKNERKKKNTCIRVITRITIKRKRSKKIYSWARRFE